MTYKLKQSNDRQNVQFHIDSNNNVVTKQFNTITNIHQQKHQQRHSNNNNILHSSHTNLCTAANYDVGEWIDCSVIDELVTLVNQQCSHDTHIHTDNIVDQSIIDKLNYIIHLHNIINNDNKLSLSELSCDDIHDILKYTNDMCIMMSDSSNVPWSRNITSQLYQPYNCRISFITRDQARECLSNQRLMFIGDSTTQELVLELISFLEGSVNEFIPSPWKIMPCDSSQKKNYHIRVISTGK